MIQNRKDNLNRFFNELERSFNESTFLKVIVSNKRKKDQDIVRVSARIVEIKKGLRLSFNYRYKTKDIEKNYSFSDGVEEIKILLEELFSDATLFTTKADIYLTENKNRTKITTSVPTIKEKVSTDHNRAKKRFVNTNGNIYLRELGVTDGNFNIRKNMHDKYRQIEKFIEIADSLIKDSRLKSPVKVADMGCGKGYLSFALFDHIKNELGIDIEMEGVELRRDLVENCNKIAERSGFQKLIFKQGSIDTVEIESVDMLIALHACDTATDDAIYKGIKTGAQIIICAPCCHKQVRKEMDITKELVPILKHGILAERESEIVTDGIRALILELHGYKTKVFEFISSHHTAKNIMITAVKSNRNPDKEKILNEITLIKQFFGVKFHHLENLLF